MRFEFRQRRIRNCIRCQEMRFELDMSENEYVAIMLFLLLFLISLGFAYGVFVPQPTP